MNRYEFRTNYLKSKRGEEWFLYKRLSTEPNEVYKNDFIKLVYDIIKKCMVIKIDNDCYTPLSFEIDDNKMAVCPISNEIPIVLQNGKEVSIKKLIYTNEDGILFKYDIGHNTLAESIDVLDIDTLHNLFHQVIDKYLERQEDWNRYCIEREWEESKDHFYSSWP